MLPPVLLAVSSSIIACNPCMLWTVGPGEAGDGSMGSGCLWVCVIELKWWETKNREGYLCLGRVEEKTGLIIDLPIHCSSPVVQVTPPHFRDGNYVIVFVLHSALMEDLLFFPVISGAWSQTSATYDLLSRCLPYFSGFGFIFNAKTSFIHSLCTQVPVNNFSIFPMSGEFATILLWKKSPLFISDNGQVSL